MYRANDIIQTSPAIVSVPARGANPKPGTIVVYEYLSKSLAFLKPDCFYWFDYFCHGKKWAEAKIDHPLLNTAELFSELSVLVDSNLLALSGTAEFRKHREFEKNWKWDTTSALFHFTVVDNEFLSEAKATKRTAARARSIRQPNLSWLNGNNSFKPTALLQKNNKGLLALMAKRRTNRTSTKYKMSSAELGECLFAGLGITGYVETPSGNLPIGMTPSGGARNPFEAFLVVRRGTDLTPGVYHYSAAEHSFGKMGSNVPKDMSALLAGQSWAADMSVYIVLVGVLERTMWKYDDPNAYRVVLIEAGHVAQNIMLAATNLGLTACPTAAIAHSAMSEALGLESITHVPLYALTLDKAKPSSDKIYSNHRVGVELTRALGFAEMTEHPQIS